MEFDDQLLPVVVGIISSLIATAIFIGLSEIFCRLVFPWIEDKIYRGVRVDGTWKLKIEDGTSTINGTSVEMEIRQLGDKVSGTCFTQSEDEKTVYKITGVLKNMYLMAYMEPASSGKSFT